MQRGTPQERSALGAVASPAPTSTHSDRDPAKFAHELLNRVSVASMWVELAREGAPPGTTTDTSLKRVQQALTDLTTLAHRWFDTASNSSAPMAPEVKAIDLVQLLEEVVASRSALRGPDRLEASLDLRGATKPAYVRGDRLALQQLFENLVGNAFKYSPADARVRVDVRTDGLHALSVTVADSGAGIPATEIDRIFEEGYRAGNVVSGGMTGWGMGLSICRDIVAQHGGDIHVRSRVDVGTQFTVTLPIAS